ncbi:MAG TPA: phosphoribosyltransferase family protein [Candidatus Angelobacter sp.]|nr:phosphoribosyltransferase family protein [Candidatus Angelobacter sp.]
MVKNSLTRKYPNVLLSEEQIRKRIREMGRRINEDFQGKTVYVVCVLENGFIFTADLLRELDIPVICQFVKPWFSEEDATTRIFYSPEVEVSGQHVLLLEAVVQSGVTTEFLMRNLIGRGAASVKLAVFLDKQSERRVSLQPDYYGFLLNETFVVGYGLGGSHIGRNLPYVALAGEEPKSNPG